MSDVGDIRYDPETGSVAIRTVHDDGPSKVLGRPMAWLVATTKRGARFVGSDDVNGWIDIDIPKAGS